MSSEKYSLISEPEKYSIGEKIAVGLTSAYVLVLVNLETIEYVTKGIEKIVT